MTVQQGTFTITPSTSIVVQGDKDFALAADFLAARFAVVVGNESTAGQKSAENAIVIRADAALGEEAYALQISEQKVAISASTGRGAFWGVQSLLQLLPPEVYGELLVDEGELSVPCVSIEDKPRFAWRGLMLDVARHFASADEVKRFIDLLALHKMNVFHWHLTEDQGWRIEIKKYPKLATEASVRQDELVGHFRDEPRKFKGEAYGPFCYSQAEIREVVEYARRRFITIVPEIELPGHSMAAIHAYPELSCTGEKIPVRVEWGISEDAYCAGKESTFSFLEDVLAEVCELFPGSYLHIGGDECRKSRWKACPDCQQRIQDEQLQDEKELQSYVIRRIEKFLNGKGKTLIGWDEILEGGLAPHAAVMSWRGEKGGIAAVRAAHDAVMSPTTHCYLDYRQATEGEPLAIGGHLPLCTVYSYDPVPAELTPAEATHIMGVQGNVWTEYMPDFEHMLYMTYPRGCAIAEVGWSPLAAKDFQDFYETRLPQQLKRFDAMHANYRRLKGDESVLKKLS